MASSATSISSLPDGAFFPVRIFVRTESSWTCGCSVCCPDFAAPWWPEDVVVVDFSDGVGLGD